MHRKAEYGGAAHWDYKLANAQNLQAFSGPSAPPLTLPTGLVQKGSYIEALNNAKQDLVNTEVFVYFVGPDSIAGGDRLLSLPVGSCVCDALKNFDASSSGDRRLNHESLDVRVLRNGLAAAADDELFNGDVLLIKHN